MKRLTSDKPVEEMGIFELAHNSCYIKDRKARYRDYDLDEDARVLVRKLLKDHADGDDAFTCDEDIDYWMVDNLQDGMDSTEGLIALFYRNLWAMADLREQLKEYEDLEEHLGFSLKEFTEICISMFEGKDKEEYRTGIFLTNDQADEWREYKKEERKNEQGITDNEYGNDMVDMIENQPKIGDWVSCSERLPEEGDDVLIYTTYDGIDMAYISDENWRYSRNDEFINTVENANILAWQPLPEPYKEAKTKKY